MKFHKQSIVGVFLIEPTPFMDDRGLFRRTFCADEFRRNGMATGVAQANISENRHAYTLRGFHYQLRPYGEDKTITCLKGKIYDIVVDVREESPTFKKWLSFELDEENRHTLHVPAGCANAFMTLVDGVMVHYYNSHAYTVAAERGIRFNDPAFGFVWPQAPRHISQKDAAHPDFAHPDTAHSGK